MGKFHKEHLNFFYTLIKADIKCDCKHLYRKVLKALISKASLTLAMGKCLWFSVKIKFVNRPFLHREVALT